MVAAGDPTHVAELLDEPWFDEMLAARLGRDVGDVKAEAAGNLREMAAWHDARAAAAWRRFGDVFIRAYDVLVDEERFRALRELDRDHSLVLLPSHRSYLDAFIGPEIFHRHGLGTPYGMGGANLNFFPFGTLAKRTGMVFIRRKMTDAPVYRVALRGYIGQLIRRGENIGWSIEGGRTRTGKLRQPVYGVLRYLGGRHRERRRSGGVRGADLDRLRPAARSRPDDDGGPRRAQEARGHPLDGAPGPPATPPSRPGLRRHRRGPAAAPAPRRAGWRGVGRGQCRRAPGGGDLPSHNRATPITPTAVATLALLGADPLTLDEVLATVHPLAEYVRRRDWPVAGGADLRDRGTIRRVLQELASSGVLTAYDGGLDTVWNQFAGARFAGPVGEPDPAERIQLVRQIVLNARAEPAIDALDRLSSVLIGLPTALMIRLTKSLGTVDLQASNIPGVANPVYLAGARVTHMYPFGPLPGCAAMVGLVSHGDTCCIGVNSDSAAIADQGRFRECLAAGFDEVTALAPPKRQARRRPARAGAR